MSLTEIASRLRGLKFNRPGLVAALTGDAGIGKSWNGGHLASEAECAAVTVPSSVSFAELFRVLPKSVRQKPSSGALIERLAKNAPVDPAQSARVLVDHLAALAPFVLLVEDLHDASDERRAWWSLVGEGVSMLRGVALIVTSRTPPPTPFLTCQIAGLSVSAAQQLIEREAGASLPVESVRWIYERAQGHPLYSLEFFRFLARRGELWSDGRRWHWRRPEDDPLPPTIEALIVEHLRVAACTPERKAVLEAWALLPDKAPRDVRTEVAGLDLATYERNESGLIGSGIFVGQGFTHPLFREIARKAIGKADLQRRSRLAITLLDARAPQAAVALLPGANLPAPEQVATLLRAAEELVVQGEQVGAATLKARAAKVADHAESHWRAQLAVDAAAVLKASNLREAERLVDWALTLTPQALDAVFLKSELLTMAGQSQEAAALLMALPAELQHGPWILRRLGSLVRTPDTTELLNLWRAHPEVHTLGGASLLRTVSEVMVRMGLFQEASSLIAQGLSNLELSAADQGELLLGRGQLEWYRGNYPAADVAFSEATRALKAGSAPEIEVIRALRNWSHVLWGLARHHEARQALEEALQRSEALVDGVGRADIQGVLGGLLIELGEYQQAEDLMLDALASLSHTGFTDQLAILHGNLAYLYLEWSPPYGRPLAMMNARAGLQYARDLQSPPVLTQALCFAAWTEARHGSSGLAQELAEEALTLAKQLGQRRSIALAYFASAAAFEAAGNGRQALRRFQAARDVMLELGLQTWAQRFALEVHRLQNHPQGAVDCRVYFETLGLLNGVHLVNRFFPQLDTQGLSPREPSSARPQLRVLGHMEFLPVDGTPKPLQGRQMKTFFAALLNARLAGRTHVSLTALQDALYPGETEQGTLSSLYQLIHRIRSRLGDDVVITTPQGYMLGDIASDAETFLSTGDTSLWRGAYLEGVDLSAEDTGGVQSALIAALLESVRKQTVLNPEEAVRLARLGLDMEPYDHEVLNLTLKALLAAGKKRAATYLFEQATQRFADLGERLPATLAQYLQTTTLRP